MIDLFHNIFKENEGKVLEGIDVMIFIRMINIKKLTL